MGSVRSSATTAFVLGALLLPLTGPAFAVGWYGKTLEGQPCSGGGQGYGPYDYSDPATHGPPLQIVEAYHFTKDVQQGNPSGPRIGNLDYTLRAFPNHYPALDTLVRDYFIDKKLLPTPPECYFYRAIVFKPNDANVYALFGVYMQRRGKVADAVKLYQQSLALRPSNPEVHYDLGLALAKLGRYAEARSQAQLAYAGGYPLPGLRNILKRAGQWTDSSKGRAPQHGSH